MLKDRFNNLDERVYQLIESMVAFNPEMRYDINQCLQSSLFDQIKSEEKEKSPEQVVKCPNNFENKKEAALYLVNEIKLISNND